MSERFTPRAVENYTVPFLVVTGLTLFMAFWLIAALFGFVSVMVTTAFLDVVVQRVIARRDDG